MHRRSTLFSSSLVFLVSLLSLPALQHCGGDPETGTPGEDAGGERSPRPGRDAAPIDEPDAAPDAGGLRTEGAGKRFKPLYVDRTYEDGAKEHAFTGFFADMEEGFGCYIHDIGPNRYACMPSMALGLEAFTDAACTQPEGVLVVTGLDIPQIEYAFVGDWCQPKVLTIENAVERATYARRGLAKVRPCRRERYVRLCARTEGPRPILGGRPRAPRAPGEDAS